MKNLILRYLLFTLFVSLLACRPASKKKNDDSEGAPSSSSGVGFDTDTDNDATITLPSSEDGVISVSLNTSLQLQLSHFAYLGSATLTSITIATLPSSGILKLSGVNVQTNDEVTALDVENGNLIYEPAAGQSGEGVDSFEYYVSDEHGLSELAYYLTISISRPNPALVVVRSDASQDISNSTYEVVNWAAEVFDHNGGAEMHTMAQDSRVTVRDPGHYLFMANVRFATSGTGMRFGKMTLNGSTDLVEQMHHGFQSDMINIWTVHELNQDDYLTVSGYQSSGGNLQVESHESAFFASLKLDEAKGARVTKLSNQTIPNSVLTSLAFDQETYDTDDFHDNTTNPSRFTISEDGWYSMSASISWSSNALSGRLLIISKNGLYGHCGRVTIATGNTQQQVGCIDYLEVGDYIEVNVIQTSGGNQTILSAASTTNFSISKTKSSSTAAASSHISADLTLSDDTWTEITWNDELSDTDTLHNSPSTQFTANSDGWYYVGFGVAWDPSVTGQRATRIILNDTTTIAMGEQGAANASLSHISAIVFLNSGDYVEASAKHTEGVDFDLLYTASFGGPGSYKSRFDFIKISDP